MLWKYFGFLNLRFLFLFFELFLFFVCLEFNLEVLCVIVECEDWVLVDFCVVLGIDWVDEDLSELILVLVLRLNKRVLVVFIFFLMKGLNFFLINVMFLKV